MRVRDVMTRDVAAVAPEAPVEEVAELLAERRVSGAPVVSEGRVVGVVSEQDVARARDRSVRIAELMTSPAITVDAAASVSAAASLMAEGRVNRLPVLHEGKLVGIVARADVVQTVGERFRARARRPSAAPAVGDRIAVARSGHAQGDRNGVGEVLEVLGRPGREVYRVRWGDGTETLYRPGRDVVVSRRA